MIIEVEVSLVFSFCSSTNRWGVQPHCTFPCSTSPYFPSDIEIHYISTFVSQRCCGLAEDVSNLRWMLDTPTPCTPQGPAYLHHLLNTAERKTDITTTFFLLLSVHSPNSFSAFMKSTWDNMGKVSKYLHCFQACKFPLSYWLSSFKRPIVRSKLMKAPCSKNSDKLCDVAAAVCVGNGGADAPPNKWLKLILSVFVTVVPSPIVKSWIILQFSPVVSSLL